MIDVNEQLTRQVAHLARLELSPAEIETFTPQLKEVLNYIEQLQEVDVEGIEPLVHPFELETPLRTDQVIPSPKDEEGQPKTLSHAPDVISNGFKVPQII